MFVTASPLRCGAAVPGRHVDGDQVKALPGELLGAVEDCLAGGVADEPAQAADHPAGAAVQVVRERDEGAVFVAVEPQGAFEGGDEGGPFLAGGERAGRDEGEPAGDLVAAGAGQQGPAVQPDPGVDEGGRQPFGKILQGVGRLGAGPGGHVQVVQLVDFTDRGESQMASDLR
jgi:hypothetical protein